MVVRLFERGHNSGDHVTRLRRAGTVERQHRYSFDRSERRRQIRFQSDGDAGLLAARAIANRIDDHGACRRGDAELCLEVARDLLGCALGVEVTDWLRRRLRRLRAPENRRDDDENERACGLVSGAHRSLRDEWGQVEENGAGSMFGLAILRRGGAEHQRFPPAPAEHGVSFASYIRNLATDATVPCSAANPLRCRVS